MLQKNAKNDQFDAILPGFWVGLMLGVVFGNVGLGMSLGLAGGLIIQSLNDYRQDEPTAARRLVIAVWGLLTVLTILIVDAAGGSVIAVALLGLAGVLVIGLLPELLKRL